MTDLATLSSASFAALRDQTATLRFHDGISLEARISSVSEQPHATPRDAPRTAFTVFFATPAPCDVAGGIADILHPQLGTLGGVLVERIIPPTLSTADAYFKLSFN